MKKKIVDIILKYVTVFFGCVVVGAFARIAFMQSGGDDYTGNIAFWVVTSLLFISYLGIVFFFHEILERINAIRASKKIIKQSKVTQENNDLEPKEDSLKPRPEILTANEKSASATEAMSSQEVNVPEVDFEEIRTQQQILLDKKKQDKLDIALDYTRKKFALYTNDEDLIILCEAVKIYSEQKEVSDDISITTTELSNLDLYHFGWNIWNFFKVSNQDSIAKFLKSVFSSLKDVEQGSIKSHLRDDEKKGIIKIEEIATPVD